jgi:mRNA-degrading endonuclease toxin of MazEF toxin-antitoxin module
MRRGEIYFVDLEPTAGREQRGHRPVIVVSPDAFNRLTAPLVAPISTGGAFARARGFAVEITGRTQRIQGAVLCHQLRTLDIAARNGRLVERAPSDVIEEMLAKIATLIA